MKFNPPQNGQIANDAWYVWVGWIFGGLVFLGVWVYSFFLIGVTAAILIGWIPAIVLGFVSGVIWPAIILLGLVFFFIAIL